MGLCFSSITPYYKSRFNQFIIKIPQTGLLFKYGNIKYGILKYMNNKFIWQYGTEIYKLRIKYETITITKKYHIILQDFFNRVKLDAYIDNNTVLVYFKYDKFAQYKELSCRLSSYNYKLDDNLQDDNIHNNLQDDNLYNNLKSSSIYQQQKRYN